MVVAEFTNKESLVLLEIRISHELGLPQGTDQTYDVKFVIHSLHSFLMKIVSLESFLSTRGLFAATSKTRYESSTDEAMIPISVLYVFV
jgi:hypothetical protein